MHKGIDVSNFQGAVDFDKVAASGRRFVIVKRSEGGDTLDAGGLGRQAQARVAGLHTGFYHFLRPRPGRNGRVEAEWFYDHVEGVKGGENGSELLRLTLDVETSKFTHVVNGIVVVDAARTLEYVHDAAQRLQELATHVPMIYTMPSFITNWGDRFADYPLWIANPGVTKPKLPKPWKNWAVWQDSFEGRVPGVTGDVDTDRCPVLSDLILERNNY